MDTETHGAAATPRVAALVPAWNPGEALGRTLDSICSQPVDCTVYVVDDGSQPPIELPDHLNSKPLHLIRLDHNQGITAALNTGLRQILDAGFDYISRHDCGDVDRSHRLQAQLGFLEHHPNMMLVGSSARFQAADGRARFYFNAPTGGRAMRRKMHYSAAVIHSTCMFRASVFESVDLYSDRYPHAEDYDLFFRILRRFDAGNVADVLVDASYDVDGISVRHRRASLASRLKIQLSYFDLMSVHSYLGVLQTLALNIVPYRVISRVKSLLPPPPA